MNREPPKQLTVSFPAKLSDELNKMAEEAGFDSISKYLLQLHVNNKSRLEKLAKIAGHINYLGYKDDIMTLEDTHADKIIGVRWRDNRLWVVGQDNDSKSSLNYKFYCTIHPNFVNLVDSERPK